MGEFETTLDINEWVGSRRYRRSPEGYFEINDMFSPMQHAEFNNSKYVYIRASRESTLEALVLLDFFHVERLHIEDWRMLPSLLFMGSCYNLKELKLRSSTSDRVPQERMKLDVTSLLPMQNGSYPSLEGLAIDSFNGDMSCLSKFTNLKILRLDATNCFPSLTFSELPDGCKSLEALLLNGCGGDMNFFSTLPNLEILEVDHFGILRFPELSDRDYESLKVLICETHSNMDLSVLSRFPNLKRLELDYNTDTPPVFPDEPSHLEALKLNSCHALESLSTPYLSGSLKRLIVDLNPIEQISRNKSKPKVISNMDFLREYRHLEYLAINHANITDFSGLGGDNIASNISGLDLYGIKPFYDLGMLKNFGQLEKLHVAATSVTNISCILNFESVRNGTFKEITLPESINWTDPLGLNTNTVLELRERGIKVNQPSNFPGITAPIITPKLYIILGPSCAGKSTLIEYMNSLGCKNVRKLSDRPERIGDNPDTILHLSTAEFKRRLDLGEIVAFHEFHKALYGVGYFELLDVQTSHYDYFLDSCDPPSALRLADQYSFVKPVLLLTSGEEIERRMRARKLQLYKMSDVEDYTRSHKNMEERLQNSSQSYAYFKGFKGHIDLIIDEDEDPFEKMKKIIGGSDE